MKHRTLTTFDQGHRSFDGEADDPANEPDAQMGRLYTVKAAADTLGVAIDTVRDWIRKGHLKAIRLGGPKGRIRIREEDWRAFLEARFHSGDDAPSAEL